MTVLSQIRGPSSLMLYFQKWPVRKGSWTGDEMRIPAVVGLISIPSGNYDRSSLFWRTPLSSIRIFFLKLKSP